VERFRDVDQGSQPGSLALEGALAQDFAPVSVSTRRAVVLVVELSVIFLGVPLAIYFRVVPNLPILFLILIAMGAVVVLRGDASFDRIRLFNVKDAAERFRQVVIRDAVLLVVLGLAVWYLAPQLLFSLVKQAPWRWAAIMALYPVFSVYPQELLYRVYFSHRYEPLFGTGPAMIAASAVAFAFVHIIFHNWLAVALSLVGGILFSLTYRWSRSLLLTCIDHMVFGNFIFTIGLGQFFFHAAKH
jgi:membrane protease YdiL (CAAX protease family)